jgi:hypothetical protein
MKYYAFGEVQKVLTAYDPEHDLGPDCPVTWREERLATAIVELVTEVEKLQSQVNALLMAVPSANTKGQQS